MKICNQCLVEKELLCFYKNLRMTDGYLNQCIDCVKKRVHLHREANLEKIRLYDKARANLPHREKARKEYANSLQGRAIHKKATSMYRKKYPMKYASHTIVATAIKNGQMQKASNCLVCHSIEKIEGHHDDYTKPLEVRWLCEKCHKEWHRKNKPIYE